MSPSLSTQPGPEGTPPRPSTCPLPASCFCKEDPQLLLLNQRPRTNLGPFSLPRPQTVAPLPPEVTGKGPRVDHILPCISPLSSQLSTAGHSLHDLVPTVTPRSVFSIQILRGSGCVVPEGGGRQAGVGGQAVMA